MSVVGGQSETRVRPLAAFRVYIEDQSSAVNAGLGPIPQLKSLRGKEPPNCGNVPPG
jgi:hypothetical protein